MRRSIILVCSLLFIQLTSAQDYIDYHNHVNEAEYWMYKEDYQKAKKLYKKAFQIGKVIPKDSYLLAKCYAALGNKKQCRKWLEISSLTPISFAPYFIKRADQIDVFRKVFSDEEIEVLSGELKVLRQQTDSIFKDDTYLMLRDSLELLVEQDQRYRTNPTDEKRADSVYMAAFRANDIRVQTNFLNLIKTHGYQDYHNNGYDVAAIILAHVFDNQEMFEAYDEVLFSELKKGNILPFTYAYMIDRWYLHNTKSCYLSMRIYTQRLCTEVDYEAIVQRRLAIGLSIYFKGPRKKPFEPHDLHPWVDEEFVEEYSLLKKIRD